MKKLLSLLSVLTINGTAVPITIAATHYKKKLNSENNYSKKYNSENLNRKKRENNQTLKQQKIVIRTNDWVRSSGVVLNNKLYVGSYDKNVYEYDPATGEQKIVIRTNDWVRSSGVVLNNKLYFGSNDNNIYEFYEKNNLSKIIKKFNLNCKL